MRFKLLPVATLMLTGGVALAADPQPYAVHFSSPGSASALMATVRASSQLESLRTNAPVGPFALIDRAEQDVGRLQTVLGSFGYYRPTVTITIDGQALNDPALPDVLTALPKSEPAKVEVRIEPGPLFHIRNITVEGTVDEAARSAMGLNSGAAAVASDVLAARDRLQTALQEEGHAYARVQQPVAYLDAHEPLLDITMKADAGPVYTFGPVHIEGQKRAQLSFLQRQLAIRSGERYRSSVVEQSRTRLLGLGIFAAVSVRLPRQSTVQNGQLPITFTVVEQALHTVTLNAAYSSDLGGSAGATWTHHDLLGHAEQLVVRASVINAGCTACNGLGYDTGAQLSKPDFLQNGQSLQLGVSALRQYLIAYNQIAEFATASLTRKLSSVWTVSAGSTLEQEQVQQQQFVCPAVGQTAGTIDPTLPPEQTHWCHYTLLGFPFSGRYDSTNLTDPISGATHGFRISLSLTPTHSLFGSAHPTFFIAQAIASTYLDLSKLDWSEPGRSIIAVRGDVAKAIGAAAYSLPPDQRLYAGGSATVRGYAYQTIGPQFPNGNPAGGTSLAAGTFEIRQRLFRNFGLAAFVDAGKVTASLPGERLAYCRKHDAYISPVQPTVSVGYGLGLRYFTPVGPIRFDVAAPANPQACDSPFEVYIGLGEAF
jgi:translocation and assembly module TamA